MRETYPRQSQPVVKESAVCLQLDYGSMLGLKRVSNGPKIRLPKSTLYAPTLIEKSTA